MGLDAVATDLIGEISNPAAVNRLHTDLRKPVNWLIAYSSSSLTTSAATSSPNTVGVMAMRWIQTINYLDRTIELTCVVNK